MARVHNFNAGPAALPLPVLETARNELVEFGDNGMSLMEMSHRSKGFEAVCKAAEGNVRKLMGVTDDYTVLFLQGGASLQFAMLPMNLLASGQTADYIDTGSWASKAIKEAKIVGKVNVAWTGKQENYIRTPAAGDLQLTPGAAYVHLCSNETIGGIRFPSFPKTQAPLIADMSSEIMSRVIDTKQFAGIYAGAQKNLGPSGLALVILRKDLAARCPETVPVFFRYSTHIENESLYNTPNTWGIYLLKLVTDWVQAQGGVAAVEKANDAKAKLLYDALDASGFWKPVADKACRSTMNITWRTPSEEIDEKLVKEATKAGLVGLKGHRSVGGLRASTYNAVPLASVQALVQFLKDFEAKNG